MNQTIDKVMRECNNYFACLFERVAEARINGSSVVCDKFEGKYIPGMLLRVHGGYNSGYMEYGEGEVYEVVSFDGETLELDHDLHTRAPYLFIAYLEPTRDFLELCADIEAYNQSTKGREGLASESIDGYSWSAGASGTDFGGAFAERLKKYKQPKPTQLYYARDAKLWP